MTLTSAEKADVAKLRKKYRRAYKMLVLTRQRGWRKAVDKLNADIMSALASVPVGDGNSALRRKTASHPDRTAMQEGAR